MVVVNCEGFNMCEDSQIVKSTQKNSKRFFSDDQGNPSSMRLMSGMALAVAAGLAAVEVFGWGSNEGKTELILYFLVAAFAPKAVQKFAEKK